MSEEKLSSDELLPVAIQLLADWCVSVDMNGSGWDDWDEHYKDAAYRPGPLRVLLDEAIAKEKALRESWHK
jgi:hypothetical protein